MSVQSVTKNDSRLAEEAVSAFGAQLRGELIQPNDVHYDEARKIYNVMIDKRPALFAGETQKYPTRCIKKNQVIE